MVSRSSSTFAPVNGRGPAPSDAGAAQTGHLARPRARGDLRILLVEDNTVNQRIALLMLQKLGFTAAVAINGSEAVAAVQQEQYDLLLMDLQMPVMDGLTASRHIRADTSLPQQPRIVAVTAHTYEEDKRACRDAGMQGFVPKPVDLRTLEEVICAVCGVA